MNKDLKKVVIYEWAGGGTRISSEKNRAQTWKGTVIRWAKKILMVRAKVDCKNGSL